MGYSAGNWDKLNGYDVEDGRDYRWRRIDINGREEWVRSDYVCD